MLKRRFSTSVAIAEIIKESAYSQDLVKTTMKKTRPAPLTHTEAGFSLVEMLVAAAIMLLVFAMMFTAFLQARKISIRNEFDPAKHRRTTLSTEIFLRNTGERSLPPDAEVRCVSRCP